MVADEHGLVPEPFYTVHLLYLPWWEIMGMKGTHFQDSVSTSFFKNTPKKALGNRTGTHLGLRKPGERLRDAGTMDSRRGFFGQLICPDLLPFRFKHNGMWRMRITSNSLAEKSTNSSNFSRSRASGTNFVP